MNDPTQIPKAPTFQVVDAAQKIIGMIAGAVSLAYLIGWRYSNEYWQKFHAKWVLDFLSPNQMLADASSLILPMIFAALISLWGPPADLRDSTLSRWYLGLALLGLSAYLVSLLPESIAATLAVRTISSVASFLLMSSEGIGIALFVRAIRRSDMKWNQSIGNTVVLMWVMIVSTVPSMSATTHAEQDRRASTSTLDVVTWSERPDGDWRLGRAVEKGFIVIKLTADPQVTEVRLVPYSAGLLIRPVNQPIM